MNVIITGATGMVGEGVLFECLRDANVETVLLVNRKPYRGAKHPKLKECVAPDFLNLEGIADQLTGYDACFYCAGVSSAGMNEADYTRLTYDVTLHFANILAGLSPQAVFIYVSGAHTDSSEQGRLMWARVKGRTENALMRCGFKAEYNFRPGFMKPTAGQKNTKSYYTAIGWLYPILRTFFPNYVSTMRDVGLAMIHAVQRGYPKNVLEIADINSLAK